MSTLNSADLAKQKAARQTDGKFGNQLHEESPVTLAAAPSPTSPKVTSRGRTVYVTLPDGSVETRTSKTREYSHAIVAHPEDPELVKAQAVARIRAHEVELARLDEALAADKLKVRSRPLVRRGDPDVDYKGEPSYVGFRYTAYSADGKHELADLRGNSKQEVKGTYDEEGNFDVRRMGKVFGALRNSLMEKRRLTQGYVDGAAATIKAVDEGSYEFGGYTVSGFSASAANADKAARANQGYMPTRRFSVQAIDE